jgi:hypothetical protein
MAAENGLITKTVAVSRSLLSIALRRDHRHELPPACVQRGERGPLRVDLDTRLRPHGVGKAGDDLSVEAIGLGEPPRAAGKVADLPRVDDRHRVPGIGEKLGRGLLQTTCGFQHDQRVIESREFAQQLPEASPRVWQVQASAGRQTTHIEVPTGDIDTDVRALGYALHRPLLADAGSGRPGRLFGFR